MGLDVTEPTKVLFLDIDGVLTTDTKKSIFASKDKWYNKHDCYPFDPICVEVFNEILDNTNADIILSSDWQKFYNLEQLEEIFKFNGVKKAPIDITRQVKTHLSSSVMMDRVNAINKYIVDNPQIEKYIIIDDLPMHKDFHSNIFAWCYDGVKGIALEGIKDKIILSLNF